MSQNQGHFVPISYRHLAGNIKLQKSLLALVVAMTTVIQGKVRGKKTDFVGMIVPQIFQSGNSAAACLQNMNGSWLRPTMENHKLTA